MRLGWGLVLELELEVELVVVLNGARPAPEEAGEAAEAVAKRGSWARVRREEFIVRTCFVLSSYGYAAPP